MFLAWPDEDQGKAIAWQIEQSERCPTCGTFHWEWGTEDEPIEAYVADGFRCMGCAAREIEQDRRKDEPDTPGVRLVLYPKGPETDGS